MFSAWTKPFDVAATLESWATTSPENPVPEFKGKPKRKDDPTVDGWLDLVEKGCSARRVPKAHWPEVAKHFMGKKAKGRVAEVEKVMRALHGEQWVWVWKGFRVAVLNMGWNIDEKKTREVQVERKATGLWRIVRGEKGADASTSAPRSPAPKSGSKIAAPSPKKTETKPGAPAPAPVRRPTFEFFGNGTQPAVALKEKEEKKDKPTPARSNSMFSLPVVPFLRPTPQPEPSMLNRISAQVPLWLLAATEALATLANDNPDVLTAIATALVAVGTVGAGGSAAVAAIGEAAVVVGRALKTAHDRVHTA